MSCTLASLANGATWTVTVDVTVDPAHPGGTISNTASAFADQIDPDGSNNSDTQDTTVTPPPPPSADVSVTKTDSADPVDPGDSYSYDLVVTNDGPDAASNVVVSDSVPAALSIDTVHDHPKSGHRSRHVRRRLRKLRGRQSRRKGRLWRGERNGRHDRIRGDDR